MPFEKVPINGKFMVKKQLERQNIFTKRAGDRGRWLVNPQDKIFWNTKLYHPGKLWPQKNKKYESSSKDALLSVLYAHRGKKYHDLFLFVCLYLW